jgi:hypothetical protein
MLIEIAENGYRDLNGYVRILAVTENKRARSPISESGSFGDQENRITPSPCQGERGIPERSKDML